MASPFSFLRKRFDPKLVSVVAGGVLAISGSAGQFFLIENLASEVSKEGEAVASGQQKIETLKNAQLQYFFAYQQGSMLFAMDPSGTTRDKQVLGNLYRLNLINRSTPLRTMLGEMAMAGVLNYRAAADGYQAVNERAREDFTWENFSALNEYERQILDNALTQQHKLQDDVFAAQGRKAEADEKLERRKLALVLLSLFGSSLMLVANLISERRKARSET